MKSYVAVRDGSGVFLSRQEQVGEYLGKGYSIFEVEKGKETLFASPENGMPAELPVFGEAKTIGITPEAIRRMNNEKS